MLAQRLSAPLRVAGSGRTLGWRSLTPGKKAVIALVAAAVIVVTLFTDARSSPDFYAYMLITDQLHYFGRGDWWTLEPASNALLLTARFFAGGTEPGVVVAQYLLSAAFVGLLYVVALRPEVEWRALLVAVAAYGALLCFVTIRATPPYFFVALAVFDASAGRLRALLWAALGFAFHVSTVLAVPPLLAMLAYTRFGRLQWLGRSMGPVLAVGALYLLLFLFFREQLQSFLNLVLGTIPFLNKYLVYTSTLDTASQNLTSEQSRSIFHTIYLVIVSAFLGVCLYLRTPALLNARPFLITGYIIYLFLQFSPVTAFRMSIFWVLPGMLIFPWARFVRGPLTPIFIGLTALIFLSNTLSIRT